MLDFRIRAYPGEPVRRDPIGVSVLLETIFLFAYLVIYVVAPHLSGYSMTGLLVVAVAAGIGVREMMRGLWGEVEFYPFETEPVPCAPTPEEPP